MSGGGPGEWDEHLREKVVVIQDGSVYKIWYVGHSAAGQKTSRVGYATSPDGVTWTKYSGNPIINRTSQDQDLSVVKVSSTLYHMYVEVDDDHVDLFTSADGVSWDPYPGNPVKAHAASPVVWREGTTWYMLYEHMIAQPYFNIHLATSADGQQWNDSPKNPVLTADNDVVPDSIVKEGSTYHLYYHWFQRPAWPAWHAVSTNLTDWKYRTRLFRDYSSQYTFTTASREVWSYVWHLRGDKKYYLRYGQQTVYRRRAEAAR